MAISVYSHQIEDTIWNQLLTPQLPPWNKLYSHHMKDTIWNHCWLINSLHGKNYQWLSKDISIFNKIKMKALSIYEWSYSLGSRQSVIQGQDFLCTNPKQLSVKCSGKSDRNMNILNTKIFIKIDCLFVFFPMAHFTKSWKNNRLTDNWCTNDSLGPQNYR